MGGPFDQIEHYNFIIHKYHHKALTYSLTYTQIYTFLIFATLGKKLEKLAFLEKTKLKSVVI